VKTGSLCSGAGGLDLAVHAVTGGELAWVADPDPGAAAILAHRFSSVPNLGDITAVDWGSVEPVDALTAGFPCQPFSAAGRRMGTEDKRHLWPHVAEAIGALRPGTVVLENVQGHLTLGFDTVLADLAALGYDAEWVTVTASAAGACHRRARLFILAFPAVPRAVAGAPVAVIKGGAWLEPCESLFGAAPFTGRVPASGRMAAGRIYTAEDSSTEMTAGLLKTPTAQLAVNGGSQHPDKRRAGGHGPTLADQVEHELLPTPTAADGDRASLAYERGNPTLIGALLPTPQAHDAVKGKTPEQVNAMRERGRAQGKAPGVSNLNEVVENGLLLPTPTSNVSGRTPEQHMAMRESIGRTTPSQLEAAARLLPTPTVADSRNSRNATAGRSSASTGHPGTTLSDVFWDGNPGGALLPTSSAGNFNDGEDLASWETRRQRNLAKGVNGNGQGTPLPVAAQQIAGAVDWGPYEAAIRRWEAVTGRPAPAPTVPGKTGQRLNPALPEWMMGLPSGWITEVPGLSRNAQLKAAGNGVLPAQAELALRILLDRAGLTSLGRAA
jgi:DNA (cytosine-5)-methyltransferase 1